jgi:predicted ATP-dependent endonuclease of OLD family
VLILNSINDNGKQVIILMDEPDRTLHPNAVFDLKKYIEKLSFIKKYFFIIATHNTFFIDKNNFHQINYVAKESSSQGTVIINHFAKKSTKEERSTFSPFIYQLGIDRESFLSLKKKIVFVEGLHDYFLFNSLYNLLKKNDNELMFIPLYGADKKSSLIPLVISINNRLPYFIFDYDEAGNKALQELKQENFVVGKMQNFTFINNLNSFKKQDKNHVVEDLFEGIEDQNHKTLKDFSKRTKQYIEFAKNIENQTIVIPEENMKKIKKLFNKIQKYFKNIS